MSKLNQRMSNSWMKFGSIALVSIAAILLGAAVGYMSRSAEVADLQKVNEGFEADFERKEQWTALERAWERWDEMWAELVQRGEESQKVQEDRIELLKLEQQNHQEERVDRQKIYDLMKQEYELKRSLWDELEKDKVTSNREPESPSGELELTLKKIKKLEEEKRKLEEEPRLTKEGLWDEIQKERRKAGLRGPGMFTKEEAWEEFQKLRRELKLR